MKNEGLHGRGTATNTGYRVEVRTTLFSPQHPTALSDGLVGPEWREVYFEKGNNPCGIPESYFDERPRHNLLTWEAATALAWTVIAQNPHSFCLECRIVEYQLKTSYTLDRTALIEGIIQPHHGGRPLTKLPYPGDDAE